MALAIATNNAALRAAASASSVNRDMETSMARLSTGKRINAARDDAAGVAIASRLAAEIRGTDQAIRNALDGQALIDSAEGGHKEIENILQRMREVSVQAANDTNNTQDRSNLQAEMNALTTEIDRIASVTTWAGQKMMDSNGSSFSFQVGNATGDKNQISVNLNAMSASALGLGGVGTISTSSYPGEFNTNDVTILSNVPGNDTAIGIRLKPNTTSGMVESYSTSSSPGVDIDGSLDPNTKIEILGIEYTIPAGTVSARLSNLAAQLQLDGISTTASTIPSNGDPVLHVDASVLADYATAFGTNKLLLYGDPLDNGDGGSNDAEWNTSQASVSLVSNYVKPTVILDNGPSINSSTNATAAIAKIDTAIKTVNTQRSELGAISNRLSHTVNNLTNISANLSTAKGVIEDADFAHETSNLAKNQILQQASTAMLAQANASKQNVLSLLQG